MRLEAVTSFSMPVVSHSLRMAARYPFAMGSFRLTVTSAAVSLRRDTNTSTLPLVMVAFTACFRASSAKDTARGSFTEQSR